MTENVKKCPACFSDYDAAAEECPHCGYSEGTQPDDPHILPVGTLLQHRYLIGKKQGSGGFGVTYAAWDTECGRKVAIKEYLPREFAVRSGSSLNVVSSSQGNEPIFRMGKESFLGESRKLAKFREMESRDNEGIVRIYDCFYENNTAYMAMEFLEGKTLRQAIQEQGKLQCDESVYIMVNVLRALENVHAKGIIHRDIAPDNIFLCDDGRVVLIDFGAARFVTTQNSRSLTMFLKPGYAPVEQYDQKEPQGPWTDVYACGATLYHAITGERPPESTMRGEKILVKPSKLVKHLPEGLETTILHAMSINAAGRIQTAKQFADELEGKVNVEKFRETAGKTKVQKLLAWLKVNTVAAAIFAVLGVGLLAGAAWGILSGTDGVKVPKGMTRVPNVISKKLEEAEDVLGKSKLRMVISSRVFDGYFGETQVAVQNPYAGDIVYQNSSVNVTVSGGKAEKVIMPEVRYLTEEEARKQLEAMGLNVTVQEAYSDLVEKGYVIDQTPSPDGTAQTGDTVVITVSLGPEDEAEFDADKRVNVPDIVGMTLEKAAALLSESKLRIRVGGKENNPDVPENTVLTQDVEAQTSVAEGTVITVVISEGAGDALVPDVVYMTEQSAAAKLAANSLAAHISYVQNERVAKGVVISQSPLPGERVKKQSVVSLTVSSGWQVDVPDVTGMKLSEAQAALQAAGLASSVSYQPSKKVAQGRVISQSPGGKLEQGGVVTLVVSSGNNSIPVTGVKLNKSSATLSRGDTLSLYATVSPNNATNTVVTWSSSNSSVASVSGGVVTAVGAGSATITATTADGNFTDSCSVEVQKKLVQLKVGSYPRYVDPFDAFVYVPIMAVYDDGTQNDVTMVSKLDWTVSNRQKSKWAYAYGAEDTGDYHFTCTYGGLSVSYDVTVEDVTGLSVNVSNMKTVYGVGEWVDPAGIRGTAIFPHFTRALNDSDINCFYGGNEKPFDSPGTKSVQAVWGDGWATTTFNVTVKEEQMVVEGCYNMSTDGECYPRQYTFSVTAGGRSIPNDSVTWRSSDSSVATVDSNGVVTAVGMGRCTISAGNANLSLSVWEPVMLSMDNRQENGYYYNCRNTPQMFRGYPFEHTDLVEYVKDGATEPTSDTKEYDGKTWTILNCFRMPVNGEDAYIYILHRRISNEISDWMPCGEQGEQQYEDCEYAYVGKAWRTVAY